MPIFFQQRINENTRLGIWKIEEAEAFFHGNVPQHRNVTHPHKRLQHLAGRFLLQFLFPDFPYALIQIADTRKPFLPDEQYHFSISHCGDYAAAIVSIKQRVGVDIELPVEKILGIKEKFTGVKEFSIISPPATSKSQVATIIWSAKEAVFKWYAVGGVDFRRDIRLEKINVEEQTIDCCFEKTKSNLVIHFRQLDGLILTWIAE
jgi:phosphopantetheinyl transferase